MTSQTAAFENMLFTDELPQETADAAKNAEVSTQNQNDWDALPQVEFYSDPARSARPTR